MVGSNFAHAPSSTWYKTSKYITWEYGTRDNPISFYLDNPYQGISEKNDGKLKFLWGIESPKYNNDFIHHCKINLDEVVDTYEIIFTYSDELIELHPKFKFIPANGFWIEESKIYEKTKLTSMICSHKSHTPLQQFRVNFANENKDKIDVMGHISKGLQIKEEGLVDYMFSVCIENDEHDTYFTEKIFDSFYAGTVPIYLGCLNVEKYLPSNVFINFKFY